MVADGKKLREWSTKKTLVCSNPRISVVSSLHNISVDIHIHYSTSRQINSKYSENTRERNHRASWSFSSTNELMEVGMWLHSCKI
jgi:hypothetical protein